MGSDHHHQHHHCHHHHHHHCCHHHHRCHLYHHCHHHLCHTNDNTFLHHRWVITPFSLSWINIIIIMDITISIIIITGEPYQPLLQVLVYNDQEGSQHSHPPQYWHSIGIRYLLINNKDWILMVQDDMRSDQEGTQQLPHLLNIDIEI